MPAPFNIATGRYEHLLVAIEGYKKTGIALVEYNGTAIIPSATLDDIGIYCIIPKLVVLLNISLEAALKLFIHGTTILAVILGLTGFFLLYKSTLARLVALAGLLLLTRLSCDLLDVYKMYTTTAIAIIPLGLYFFQKKPQSLLLFLFLFLSGIGLGYAHYIRAHSGGPALIFLLIMIITHALYTWHKKLLLITTIFFGFLIPVLHFKSIHATYKAYAQEHFPNYTPDADAHPFWHTLYVGFGFLNNDFGLSFNDKAGVEKVLSIDPSVPAYTAQYEAILKNEVLHLVRAQPWFVVKTIWAKLGVFLIYFLFFANIGIGAALWYPKNWRVEVALFGALCFSSIFSLVAIPSVTYMPAFVACSTLYGIISINHAIEHGALKYLWKNIKKKISIL
jgi:hypothetical protein